MTRVSDALLVSGSGPYADAWHSFPETSARIAGIIGELGLSVEITEDVEGDWPSQEPAACLSSTSAIQRTSVRLS
jgi:hypothetical protein